MPRQQPRDKGASRRVNDAHDEEDVPEDVLLRNIEAMGGSADDMELIKGRSSGPALSEAELSSELQAFMARENMASELSSKGKVEPKRPSKAIEAKVQPAKRVEKTKAAQKEHAGQRQQAPAAPPPAQPSKHIVFDRDMPRTVEHPAQRLALLIEPTPEWTQMPLPALEGNLSRVSDADIAALHEIGQQTLDSENEIYTRLSLGEGGKHIMLGALSLSDLQFARTLLTSNKAGTLSDRISAVTLLLQSSPIHNLKALDTLMTMSGKPSREEASRATRALADWFASGGGLGAEKLHYFRDQPALGAAAVVRRKSGITDALRKNLCVWTFEDFLKRTYFAFVQILERQSHDTLLFMRRQAVTQVYVLLRDKAEQEHNLLRLLTNKLGDPDRSVASKASTHLMELLQVHPAMKEVVLREVSETVLHSQVAHAGEAKGNQHATYYGVLAMNQTLFTAHDAPLANDVFSVYFQLFDVCLAREAPDEAPKEDTPRDKKRWRDRGKQVDNKAASDVDNRLLAAILTGIRRVFPFTTWDTDAYVRMSTLTQTGPAPRHAVSHHTHALVQHCGAGATAYLPSCDCHPARRRDGAWLFAADCGPVLPHTVRVAAGRTASVDEQTGHVPEPSVQVAQGRRRRGTHKGICQASVPGAQCAGAAVYCWDAGASG